MTPHELAARLDDDELISLNNLYAAADMLRDLAVRNKELEMFINKAFMVHPNLDIDIERI